MSRAAVRYRLWVEEEPAWLVELADAIGSQVEPASPDDAYDFVVAIDGAGVEAFLRGCRLRGDVALVVTANREREAALLDAGACDAIVWPVPRVVAEARIRRSIRALDMIRDAAALRARVGSFTGADATREAESLGAQLHAQLQLFRRALDVYPGIMHVQDAEGRFVIVNKTLADIHKVMPAALVGKTLCEVGVRGEDVDAWRQAANRVFAGEIVREEREVSVDGETRIFQITRCLLDGAGRAQMLTVGADVTELRKARELASIGQERALEASRLKSRFLANMSHEIRTPMNGILGMTALALETSVTDEQREYLEAVQVSAKGLLAIINDILDLSKIEANRMTVESVPFDLEKAAQTALLPLGLTAEKKGITLDLHVAENARGFVASDPVRVTQVLVNVAGNAVKFTERGRVLVAIERDGAETMRVRVEDTGVGIPADKLTTIFQPFVQADDKTTRRFGGTGLGLAICHEVSRLLGGEIKATSREGFGSTFVFTFRAPAVDRHETHESNVHAPRAAPAVSSVVRVLLAEDNPINSRVVTRMLEKLGCEITHVLDGAHAVDACLSGAFDLVLMDVEMPAMDGLEATRRIRAAEKNRRTRIAALTANAMEGDDARCREAGMDDFLTKPVDRDALVDLVEDVRAKDREPAAVDFPGLLKQCANDESVFVELVEVFLHTWHEGLQGVRDAFAGEDAVAIARAAHYVKGTGRAMHADALADVAESIEHASRAGDVTSARTNLQALERAFARAVSAFSAPSATLLAAAR